MQHNTSITNHVRPFQMLFLFVVLFFTENLPSLQEKKTNECSEKNKLYPTEIIGILQLMSSQICWIVSSGSSDLFDWVKWALKPAELGLARKASTASQLFLILPFNLTEHSLVNRPYTISRQEGRSKQVRQNKTEHEKFFCYFFLEGRPKTYPPSDEKQK